jgi:hypothetical protein
VRPTSQEASTGGISAADLTAAQTIEALEVGAQTIPHGRAAGINVFKIDPPEYDSLGQRLVGDPSATVVNDAGWEVSSYTVQQGWWLRQEPGQVEAEIAHLPRSMIEAVQREVVDFLRQVALRWQGACRVNGGPAAAEAEGFVDPGEDIQVRHARSVLQVVDTELRKRP